eukprot:jgi/Hompol1/3453/HPOL_001585-RA
MTTDEIKQRIEALRERRLARAASAGAASLQKPSKLYSVSGYPSLRVLSPEFIRGLSPDGSSEPRDTGSKQNSPSHSEESLILNNGFDAAYPPVTAALAYEPAKSQEDALVQPQTVDTKQYDIDDYEAESFEDPASLSINLDLDLDLDLDTTQDDKDRFFATLKMHNGDQSVDYAALNQAISDDDDDDLDLDVDVVKPWTKTLLATADLEPSIVAEPVLDPAVPPADDSIDAREPEKALPTESMNEIARASIPVDTVMHNGFQASASPVNLQATPTEPALTPAGVGDTLDTYSATFESVSKLDDQQVQDPALSSAADEPRPPVHESRLPAFEPISEPATDISLHAKLPATQDQLETLDTVINSDTTHLPESATHVPRGSDDAGVHKEGDISQQRDMSAQQIALPDYAAADADVEATVQLDHVARPVSSDYVATQSNQNHQTSTAQPYLTFEDLLALNAEPDDTAATVAKPTPTKPKAKTRTKSPTKSQHQSMPAATVQSPSQQAASKIPTPKRVATDSGATKHATVGNRPTSPSKHRRDSEPTDIAQAKQLALKRTNARFASQKPNTSHKSQRAKVGSGSSFKGRIAAAAQEASSNKQVLLPPSKHGAIIVPSAASQHDHVSSAKQPEVSIAEHDRPSALEAHASPPLVHFDANAHHQLEADRLIPPASTPTSFEPSSAFPLHILQADPFNTTLPLPVDLAELYTSLHKLREQVSDLTKEKAAIESDRQTLCEQIGFLQQQLDKEETTAHNVAARARSEPAISQTEADALRKEIADQETLIRGFQTENEKLMAQVKNLRKELKESDQRHYLKQDALIRENHWLKAQLNSVGGNADLKSDINGDSRSGFATYHDRLVSNEAAKHGDFTAVKSQVRIEALEADLATLRHTSQAKESDLKARITQLEAQLHEARSSLETLSAADPEKLKKLEADQKAMREKYDAYIVELEGKLEMYMETAANAEIDPRHTKRQEILIEDLKSEIKRLEHAVLAGHSTAVPSNTGTNAKQGSLVATQATGPKRLPADVRRIKELEAQVETLREERDRRRDQLPIQVASIVQSAKPVISESDYVAHLKQRVRKLQREHDAVVIELQSKTSAFEDEIKQLRKQYEARVRETETSLRDLQASSEEDLKSARLQAANEAAAEIQALERQLAMARSGATDADLNAEADHGGQIDSSLPLLVPRSQEISLRRRLVELDRLVEDQARRIEEHIKERQQAEASHLAMCAEKDALIDSYKAKIIEMQQDFQHKIFAVDDHARMDQIHRMRLDLEACRAELADAKSKLEVSEATRHAVHETTVSILKHAQEEAAKIALAHHEGALTLLRNELRREVMQTAAATEAEAIAREHRDTSSGRDRSETPADASPRHIQLIRRMKQQIATLEAALAEHKQSAAAAASMASGADATTREWTQAKESELKSLTIECARLRDLVASLQADKQRLQNELASIKQSWPLEARHFEALSTRIRELEESAHRRESGIMKLLDQRRSDWEAKLQSERQRFNDTVRAKDAEIQGFRNELDNVLESIRILRRQQMHSR